MNKMFYPNDGRPPISFTSKEAIAEYMGEIMNGFGPIEIEGDSVLTQIQGHYLKIGEVK
ncbi:MAG: hypothetical protein IJ190_10390 [Prevotella sp.]|nr:hypothetical protein [Prevotella sp.]